MPREFDVYYDQPDSYEHSRPCTPSEYERGTSKVRFPMGAARPLIAQKGSAVMWSVSPCIVYDSVYNIVYFMYYDSVYICVLYIV